MFNPLARRPRLDRLGVTPISWTGFGGRCHAAAFR